MTNFSRRRLIATLVATRPRAAARSAMSGASFPARGRPSADVKRPFGSDGISHQPASHRPACPTLVASFAAGVASWCSNGWCTFQIGTLITTCYCAAPVRCGAFVDERRVVGGEEVACGREMLIQLPLGGGAPKIPNIALMRLAAYHRERGDAVEPCPRAASAIPRRAVCHRQACASVSRRSPRGCGVER